MVTTVPGPVVRSVGFDSFADLLPGVAVTRIAGDGVTFDADLTEAQVELVREFITARDDEDQAARANLAALRDSDPVDCEALLVALTDYILGT